LSADISKTDRDIQKRKTKLSSEFLPALDRKSLVNFGPLSTAFSRLMFTHKIDLFGKPYFGPQGVMCPKILTRISKWPSLASLYPTGNGDSPNNFFQWAVKNWLEM